MEDLMKFLAIAGVIAFGIYRQFSKDKAQHAENEPPVSIPADEYEEEEASYDEKPMPLFSPQTPSLPPSQEGIRSTYVPTPSSISLMDEPESTDGEFAIHSEEEARRAIVWSEILQRKYEQ